MKMILIFYILDKNKNELFKKFFVEKSYFSNLQIKTIMNTTSRLVNIVNLISKGEKVSYYSRMFTIANLWFHIIKYHHYFYVIVTPTMFIRNQKPFNMEKEYSDLIKQIEDSISQFTSRNPHFDLKQNQYFSKNVERLLNQFNIYFVKRYNKEVKYEEDKINKISKKKYIHDSKGKYLIVGPASAGKSSIIAQFFSNWSQEKLQNIRPTINKEINTFKDSLLNHSFNLVDLGGQVQYVEMHLRDPNLFLNINTLIYVIDIQDQQKMDFTKQYLLDIVEILKSTNEKPFISIFLHKFDPGLYDDMYNKVQHWIEWIDNKLGNIGLDYSYYITSIKDDSAREALARTLILTLPTWFLASSIKEDLIIRSINSLSPIIKDLDENLNNENNEMINKELFQQSTLFGFAATKIIINKWMNYLLNKQSISSSQDISNTIEDLVLRFNDKDSQLEIEFKCPLLLNDSYNNITNFTNVCEITHGIITGLSQFIGLGSVDMNKTQIRNKSKSCLFKIQI